MVHCYEHIIEATDVVCRLVGGSSDSSFQLNEHQCQILVEELVQTITFLEKKSASKIGEGVGSISLRHLCFAIKRAEVLVKKCYCKDLESWLVSAMMLVEIQEEFMAIILDIHLWRMLLDFAISCGRGSTQEKKVEEMKIMDEEYHQLFKDLCRESHAIQQATVKDKSIIISRTSRIANLGGLTNGLDHLRAIYLQSWLTSGTTCRDMDLRKCEYLHLLGQGGSGAVMKVKWLGIECALKMLVGQDEKEATTLKGLFHPNIIHLFHYWEDHLENPQSRLLMELMPKDLGAYIRGLLKGISSSKMQMGKDSVPFSLPVAIDIMYQIAQAMRYMHDKHLTHRDLKPANILVKERPRADLSCDDGVEYLDIKLVDFGLVKSYTNTSTFQAYSRNKGTGMYRAPEIIGNDMAQKRHYLPMSDVWSFGITCAEILSGKQAYTEYVNKSPLEIQTMICKEGLRPTLAKHCPPYLAFCIKSCLEFSPSRRPTFASICKLLRHAQLLSLGVTKLDDSKFFFAYSTRSDQVQSLDLSPSSSKARISTFFQSSLKLMRIGPRRVPNAAKDLPAAALMHEVRLVPTPLIPEDSRELDEDVGAGIATPGSLIDGERHYSAVLPVTDVLHEERVVSTPMVTEENPLVDTAVIAGSIATLANPTQVVKSLPDLQERHYSAVLPVTDVLHEERVVSTPMVTEEYPLVDTAVIAGSIATLANPTQVVKSLPDLQERHYSAVLPVTDVLHEERVVSTPMVTEEYPLVDTAVIAGSIATLANPTQVVKSLPDLQEPVQLTQASLGTAISPSNASDEIQPAILPQKKLDITMLKKKRTSKLQYRTKDNVTILNPRENHSRQKNKEPGCLPSHIQDCSEGKSAELELPKFREAASASIKLPKPSPNKLLFAVMGVKSTLFDFVEVFITNMNKHPVELEYLKQTIIREVGVDMDRADHWKFLVQAFICKRFFDGFDAPNGYFGIEDFENDIMTMPVSFGDFSKFKGEASTISMLLDSDSPHDSFLGRFCFKKFKSIFGQLPINQPLPIYQEEWDAIERGCHPTTGFYRSFLKVAVSVWLLHRLAHSFEEKVEMLIYEKGAKFERRTMESVVPGSYKEEDEEAGVNTEVGFSLIPGFQVINSVVKCEVYLRSRSRHPGHVTAVYKMPAPPARPSNQRGTHYVRTVAHGPAGTSVPSRNRRSGTSMKTGSHSRYEMSEVRRLGKTRRSFPSL